MRLNKQINKLINKGGERGERSPAPPPFTNLRKPPAPPLACSGSGSGFSRLLRRSREDMAASGLAAVERDARMFTEGELWSCFLGRSLSHSVGSLERHVSNVSLVLLFLRMRQIGPIGLLCPVLSGLDFSPLSKELVSWSCERRV